MDKKRKQLSKQIKPSAPASAVSQRVAMGVLGIFATLVLAVAYGSLSIPAHTSDAPVAVAEAAAATATPTPPANPAELSPEDRGLYTMIFSAEAAGRTADADAMMVRLSNPRLIGYVLAERYQRPGATPTNEQLSQWLAQYRDHPQAKDIAALARARGIHAPLATTAPLKGDGYSDHEGRAAMPDRWYTALSFWREGDVAAAAPIFQEVSTDGTLSDWQRAAAMFWSYRAAERLGDSHAAARALSETARYPTTFYGQLALEKQGHADLHPTAPTVSATLRADARTLRAGLLAQLSRTEDAEAELRALYTALPKAERKAVVTLAAELNLPNLQLRLARDEKLSSAEALYAAYPAPSYMQGMKAIIDPALLLAVARNESGFREVAQSPAGALGMMQMMPATARAVERRVGEKLLREASAADSAAPLADRLSNPALSARYGAEYLRMIASEPSVKRNLVHLLVGYNAGVGTVISWKAAGHGMDDPLLYIESIPYPETHNYVMQVMAQYWVYQQLLGAPTPSRAALVRGQWPMV